MSGEKCIKKKKKAGEMPINSLFIWWLSKKVIYLQK